MRAKSRSSVAAMNPSREIILFSFVCSVVCLSHAVQVTIPNGKIIGSDHLKTRHGKVIYSFTGIPYARPPIGNLRFKVPQPMRAWKTPLNATQNGPDCPQINIFKSLKGGPDTFGQEDCLFLNVYSPKVSNKAKLPVIVFIHGGAYSITGVHGGPEFLLDRDVVFVNFNYRIGALGFMTTGDGVVPANLGMKDQVLALKWVHDNIKNFGGDPSLVTVMGTSVGGSSVHMHLMSRLSKGYVHRGISMSGTSACPWAMAPMQLIKDRTKALAVLSGCPSEPPRKLLDCMLTVPVETLLEMQHKFQDKFFLPLTVFTAVIEPGASKHAFLTSESSKSESSIPWMAGFSSSEESFLPSKLSVAAEKNEFDLKEQFDSILPKALFLDTKLARDEASSAAQQIRKFYLGEEPVDQNSMQKLVEMFSDSWVMSGTMESVSKYMGDAYLYYYDYLASVSLSSIFGPGTIKGVSHGDDLLSIFPVDEFFPNRTLSEKDLEVSEKMLDLWTSFAKYGKPTVNTSMKWEPVVKKVRANKYLHISADGFAQKDNLLLERVEFWSSLKNPSN